MKTSLTRVYTKDNLELVGLLHEPDQGSKKVLVHVHGMAGNFYENIFLDYMADTLTANGISFIAFNNRGSEYIKDIYKVAGGRRKTVRIGDTFEKFEDCIADIGAAIDFLDKRGFAEIHISGHSLGGPKVAYYVSVTKDKRLKSVIFMSPADMVGFAKADKDYDAVMKMAREMISRGKGDEIMPKLLWGESYLSANAYMSLCHESSKVAIFNLYDLEDKLSALSDISIPSLTVMGKKDGALSVPVEQLMERVKKALSSSEKVQTIILGDANHQYDDYQQELADAITRWIQSAS